MKKLLLLSLTILLFSCGSNNSVDEEPEPSEPSKISLTVKEKWDEGLSYNYQNTSQRYCQSEDREYLRPSNPFILGVGQSYTSLNHYSIETLELSLDAPSNVEVFGFNLGPISAPSITIPKYINHIELVGFDTNDKILLNEGALHNYHPNDTSFKRKIIYFSSNVSEEFLNSLVYDKSTDFCPSSPEQIFIKKSEEEYNNIVIKEIQIPYNEENISLRVGDLVLGSNLLQRVPCGNCNEIRDNGPYTIIGKEYID